MIDEAAKATRRYWPSPHWEFPECYVAAHDYFDPENVGERYSSYAEAQASCDRLNLRAVLEAIRDVKPPVWFENGQPHAHETTGFVRMIDVLLAECGGDASPR